jgi:D-erythronate 2-dehydrogenase
MTVVVTGAGGFVGRRLVELLLERGESVVGIDSAAGAIPAGARAVAGDLADAAVRADALRDGCTALIHLATVPGGAAEADPKASRRVNVDAMYDLVEEAAAAGTCPRVVYASSIAALGEHLPRAGVDDQTPLSPHMIYGGHKAMMEHAVAMFSNRGAIQGMSLRLPGILARPKAPSGMKSAFMSDLFHALKAGEAFTCPVSPDARIWAESLTCVAKNFVHGLDVDPALLPAGRAMTLPALHIRMGDMVAEIARQCGCDAGLVRYAPEPALEAAFGNYPPLATAAADKAGFAHDGTLVYLVESAIQTL